jgi:hypothetical protein
MKKSLFAIALLVVFAAVASAQVTSNSLSVTLKAVSPEFISLQPTMSPNINFNFQPGSTFADGDQMPGLAVSYNLASSKTITVCAYLSGPLQGLVQANTISADAVNLNAGNPGTLSFKGTACGQPNGLTWTSFSGQQGSKSVTSTGMFIQTGSKPPVPDTYTGTMNIVAQTL